MLQWLPLVRANLMRRKLRFTIEKDVSLDRAR